MNHSQPIQHQSHGDSLQKKPQWGFHRCLGDAVRADGAFALDRQLSSDGQQVPDVGFRTQTYSNERRANAPVAGLDSAAKTNQHGEERQDDVAKADFDSTTKH